MMTMRKFALVALSLLLAIMLFAFTACGSTEQTPGGGTDGGSDTESGSATVTELELMLGGKTTEYFVGQSFDASKVVIRAYFSDGSKKVFVAGREKECTITPAVFSAGDTSVTFTYGGKSVSQSGITVVDEVLSSVAVDTSTLVMLYGTGSVIDLSELSVTAHYGEYELSVDDYQVVEILTDGTEKVHENAYDLKLDVGVHTFKVRYYDKDSETFEIEVFNGYVVEAENIVLSENVTDQKNYVELINKTGSATTTTTQIAPGPIVNTEEPASGNSYLGEVQKGAVFAFHLWSDVETKADIILRASSGLLLSDTGNGSWVPVEMGNMQFNRLFDVTYKNSLMDEAVPVEIYDSVILEGGYEAAGNRLLWVNWMDVSFGTMYLKPGDNVFTFTVTSNYENMYDKSCACNIDRIEVKFHD